MRRPPAGGRAREPAVPAILLYYLGGLTVALAIGVVCYYSVGFSAGPFLQTLFGEQAGQMWGRLFRMSVVTIALIGGLSSKFYGCGGPTDYTGIAHSHARLFSLTTEQVSSSLQYSVQYLLAAAAVGAAAYAVHRVRNP